MYFLSFEKLRLIAATIAAYLIQAKRKGEIAGRGKRFLRASARHCVFDDTWTAPLARKAWSVNRPGGYRPNT